MNDIKLDEGESLALIGSLRERQLPVSYLGTSQPVPDDFTRAASPLLAAASVLGEPTNSMRLGHEPPHRAAASNRDICRRRSDRPPTHDLPQRREKNRSKRMNAARHDNVDDEHYVAERNQLVMDNMGLVKALALRMARRVPAQVEVKELMSVGMVGLIDAAGRYQVALGVPFDAFARRRVHGAMLDWLRNLDWAPRSARKMRRDVDTAIARLRHELQREPTGGEIAGALGVSEPAYDQMLEQVRSAEVVMVRPFDLGAGDSSVLDVAIDPDEGPYLRLESAEVREHLAHAIAELPERERHILSLYYQQELTLAEIGAVIGVGESRVSQLRTQAVARLRTRLRQTLQLAEMG